MYGNSLSPNGVPVSPSNSVHLWMLTCLVLTSFVPCLEKPRVLCGLVTETLVPIYNREVMEVGRDCLLPHILQAPVPPQYQR